MKLRSILLAAVVALGLPSPLLWAQQTQILWGYLAGTPSQIQFKIGPTWYPIGTFDGTSFSPTGGGTVTSVGLSLPAAFTISGSPVTGAGTLSAAWANQVANCFFAGPASGPPAATTCRAIVPADVPLMVGDSGAGGTAGLVPAPPAGSSAAGKFLHASGSFSLPAPTGRLHNAVVECGADPTGVADSTTAINSCLSTYKAVALPAGTYKTTAQIDVPTGATFSGAGMGETTISLNSTTADAVVTATGGNHVYLSDMRITRVGVPVGAAAGIRTDLTTGLGESKFTNIHVDSHQFGMYLGPTDYSVCDYCISDQNYSDGIYITNSVVAQTVQWQLLYTLSASNDGRGIAVVGVAGAANTIQGEPWIGVTTFANTNGGIAYIGQAGVLINDIKLQNCVLSYDGNDELQIQAFGGGYAQVQGCLIEGAGNGTTGRGAATPASHVGNGIKILNGIGDIEITGNVIETNSNWGISAVDAIESIIISNNHVIRNSTAVANTYDGIIIDGTSVTKSTVVGNNAFDDAAPAQRYGIVVNPAPTSSIVASNNATGVTAGCFLTDASIVYGNSGVGCMGRAITSSVASGAAVALTTAVAANVTSVSLPAGDWTCTGNVNFYPAATTVPALFAGWISTTSATIPTRPNGGSFAEMSTSFTTGANLGVSVGSITLSLGATTTVYLSAFAVFTTSTMGAGGYIGCRRAL